MCACGRPPHPSSPPTNNRAPPFFFFLLAPDQSAAETSAQSAAGALPHRPRLMGFSAATVELVDFFVTGGWCCTSVECLVLAETGGHSLPVGDLNRSIQFSPSSRIVSSIHSLFVARG